MPITPTIITPASSPHLNNCYAAVSITADGAALACVVGTNLSHRTSFILSHSAPVQPVQNDPSPNSSGEPVSPATPSMYTRMLDDPGCGPTYLWLKWRCRHQWLDVEALIYERSTPAPRRCGLPGIGEFWQMKGLGKIRL